MVYNKYGDKMNKVVVIGCGKVGMAYIFALISGENNVSEIVMIDADKSKLEGEKMDLCHALSYATGNIKLKLGDYNDLADADIVCITAGPSQSDNDRLADLTKAKIIYQDIFEKINKTKFNGILLIASNPLDVMSYYAYRLSNLPQEHIIGSGTSLDTSRLGYMISEKVNINPKSIQAYVIGEHGNSELVVWSSANIAGQNINKFLTKDEMHELEEKVKRAAFEIIERKGATYYGIAMSLVRITNAILDDESVVIPVSNYDARNDVYISTTCVIGRDGIKQRIYMDLNDDEKEKLQNSIDIVKKAISSLK